MSTSAVSLDRYPLRERKRARLRVGLWRALKERIETTPFTDISVRELTAAMEVSEPTFFAHFTSKAQLLAYHIALWRIGTTLEAAHHPDGAPFLRAFFTSTAEAIRESPQMWFEITAEVARGAGLCEAPEISAAERLLVFGIDEALAVPATPQSELFARHLATAWGQGPDDPDVDQATTALLAAFYGVPLALGHDRLDELDGAYHHQIEHVLAYGRRP
ncbi:AcrR family transcriptional regulator [Lipingzhangella halophila]|uniref:AcrR family transcriptional regulator n=1 Tax=Lipingzhangella halophila TaxID=1783352 RepID=A0A7W7RNW5_9ACTN|nr:TetR family transcriptional regulator [Lipingzhangella halophila]MBB4935465.1 AcrR family transcriptional regulator [Lipingzhangella halophila]